MKNKIFFQYGDIGYTNSKNKLHRIGMPAIETYFKSKEQLVWKFDDKVHRINGNYGWKSLRPRNWSWNICLKEEPIKVYALFDNKINLCIDKLVI